MKENSSPNSPSQPLLRVEGLCVDYAGVQGTVRAVDHVSFQIHPGETLGLVGESGSGKTSVALSLLRLLPASGLVSGSVRLSGKEILALSSRELRQIRGRDAAMVFQEPHVALDPLSTILSQLREAIGAEGGVSRQQARSQALELLEEVGIEDPERCLKSYPHQLSGGMLQRVLIAMALSRSPRLLIGDEPTSALDTTIQVRILALLRRLRETRRLSMLLISHDLGVVAQLADRVAVMHSGQIVETAPVDVLFSDGSHPYTRSLLASVAGLGDPAASSETKEGRVGPGCRYSAACPEAEADCSASNPPLYAIGAGRQVRCFRRRHLAETVGPAMGSPP